MDSDAIPRRARYWIAGLAFALCVAVIAATGVWGNPNNAIHYFGATAAWGVVVLLLVGFGFGAGMNAAAAIIGKK
jgi:F0F1-type ATP synthase assembly protein I